MGTSPTVLNPEHLILWLRIDVMLALPWKECKLELVELTATGMEPLQFALVRL